MPPGDHKQRRNFVDRVLENKEVDDEFKRKIIISDEAHFQFNGFVNNQNCRIIFSSENTKLVHTLPQKVNGTVLNLCRGSNRILLLIE